MAKAFKFQLLLELARERTETDAKLMVAARGRWQDSEQKLQQLDIFTHEYQARLAKGESTGMQVSQWRDFQLFIGKLDAARQQQREEIGRCRSAYELARAAWLESQNKQRAFEALEVRHAAVELRTENKREQKESDEFGARKGLIDSPAGFED